MNYPTVLLPKQKFKIIQEDLSGYCVLRKIPQGRLPEDTDALPDAEVLGIETASDCFDYSTNLPGHYRIEHNKLALIGPNRKYFRTYWQAGDVEAPVFGEDFNDLDPLDCIYLPIGKIHRKIKHPFKRGEKMSDEYAEAVVLHTPTNCNFWHFSIRWQDAEGTEIKASDAKWKEKLVASIRAAISNLILREPCTEASLPEICYLPLTDLPKPR